MSGDIGLRREIESRSCVQGQELLQGSGEEVGAEVRRARCCWPQGALLCAMQRLLVSRACGHLLSPRTEPHYLGQGTGNWAQ